MLQIAIVVFREILEIALIVGILVAATKNISKRTKWIVSGVGAGLLGSLTLAFFTDQISESFDGMGQEFFNGMILLSASFMISWTVLWMQKHARSISGKLKTLSDSIRQGDKPLYALMIVVFLSVLREGAEVVLFTYSAFISGVKLGSILLGLIFGTLSGIAIGIALYLGIIKASGKYFFIVTSWILIFLAAGIASSGVGFLVNAEFLPALGDPIWDSSAILSQSSYVGQFLHIFMGYIDRPAGIQVLAYFLNLGILIAGMKMTKRAS